jgi:uncharacterized protein YcgI (DUF1989 family)
MQVDGKQVSDAVFVNYNDHREFFVPGHSCYLNNILGVGNTKHLKFLYSQPPYENVLAEVTEDTHPFHFAYNGTHCSRLTYKLRNVDAPPHRSCQSNLAEALRPFGFAETEVPPVFNIWMNVDIDERHDFIIKPTNVNKEDYITFEAKMDLIVAFSSCPSDITLVNSGSIKPLEIVVKS